MGTIVRREMAKNAINDVCDQLGIGVLFNPLEDHPGDGFLMICQASRADHAKLVQAIGEIGLESSSLVIRSRGTSHEWEIKVQVPETWTEPEAVGEPPTAHPLTFSA